MVHKFQNFVTSNPLTIGSTMIFFTCNIFLIFFASCLLLLMAPLLLMYFMVYAINTFQNTKIGFETTCVFELSPLLKEGY
jgi:ABC-type bacteriocin/lantibiotic exporter with double-glycine peptidase domain